MEHVGEVFDGRDVRLDGSTFTDCTFRRSNLVFTGTAACAMRANRLEQEVHWLFDGCASRTLEFLSMLYHESGEGGREVVEEVFEKVRRGWAT